MKWPPLLALLVLISCGCGSNAIVQEPGVSFPEFELASHDGTTVTRADLLGKTSVIWFYPKASTPG
jgi:cytochrome oxidase Cu insertion factor (SCO1/SenC/PrrC family)